MTPFSRRIVSERHRGPSDSAAAPWAPKTRQPSTATTSKTRDTARVYFSRRGTGFAGSGARAVREGTTHRIWAARREAPPVLHTVVESRETFDEATRSGATRRGASASPPGLAVSS